MKGTMIVKQTKKGDRVEKFVPEGSEDFYISTMFEEIIDLLKEIKGILEMKWEK